MGSGSVKAVRACGGADSGPSHKKEDNVLETVIVVLVILWLLGIVTSYTMGGLIHILLVIAIIVVLLRIIRGRRL